MPPPPPAARAGTDAPRPRARLALCAVALGLGACATNYDLTLKPRDGDTPTYGTAQDLGNGQATVSVTVKDRIFTGTWTPVAAENATNYVDASSWGWSGWGPFGTIHRSRGDGTAKALLQSSDGGVMRCDFFGLAGGSGSGRCTDDKGLLYDVQIRSRKSK